MTGFTPYRLNTILILLALVGIFGLVGYAAFGTGTAVLIVLVGLLVNFATRRQAARMVLHLHRARPLEYREAPRIHGIVNELSRRAGVAKPELAVYPSDTPNAFALSLGGDEHYVAVSTGLLRLLNLDEIRGVLAHEVAHVRNSDSLISLSAGLFVQATSTMATVFGFLLLFLAFSGYVIAGVLETALIVVFAPHLAQMLHAGLMRTRERQADRDASMLTGEPRALASALAKLERYNRYLAGIYRRFRFIYTTETDAGSRWLSTHPSTEERIRALLDLERALAPTGGYRRAV